MKHIYLYHTLLIHINTISHISHSSPPKLTNTKEIITMIYNVYPLHNDTQIVTSITTLIKSVRRMSNFWRITIIWRTSISISLRRDQVEINSNDPSSSLLLSSTVISTGVSSTNDSETRGNSLFTGSGTCFRNCTWSIWHLCSRPLSNFTTIETGECF